MALTGIHGSLQAGARTQLAGFSTPAFPRRGGRCLRAERLGVPRAKSQWKNMWPSHGGESTGQSSYAGVGHWPRSGKGSGGLGHTYSSLCLRVPFPSTTARGPHHRWGVENIPFAPSGPLTWKTQMDYFNKKDRAKGNEVAGPSQGMVSGLGLDSSSPTLGNREGTPGESASMWTPPGR